MATVRSLFVCLTLLLMACGGTGDSSPAAQIIPEALQGTYRLDVDAVALRMQTRQPDMPAKSILQLCQAMDRDSFGLVTVDGTKIHYAAKQNHVIEALACEQREDGYLLKTQVLQGKDQAQRQQDLVLRQQDGRLIMEYDKVDGPGLVFKPHQKP